MDNRSFQSGAAGSAPSAPSSPSSGYPTNGNPGAGTPATIPGEYWYHQIGEELRHLIDAAGLTPSSATLTQLKSALDTLYGSTVSSAVQSASGVSMTSDVVANITSISLPPGKWLVSAQGSFHCTAGTPAYSGIAVSVSTTSATVDGMATSRLNFAAGTALYDPSLAVAAIPIEVAVTTTIYLVSAITIVTGTWKGYGQINAVSIVKG